jgi:hypothetical protein
VLEVEMKGKQKAKRLGGWEAMKLGSEEGKKITGEKMGGGEAGRLDKFFG